MQALTTTNPLAPNLEATIMAKTQTRIVEQRDVERDYGFRGVEAIIDHPAHGRVLIVDGFGGMDTLAGGCVRWRHGLAVKLQPGDTFDRLDESMHNEWTTELRAALTGYSETRPFMDWDGRAVAQVAKSIGL